MKLIVDGGRSVNDSIILDDATDVQEAVKQFYNTFDYWPDTVTRYDSDTDQEPAVMNIAGICEWCEHAIFEGEKYDVDEDGIYGCKDHLFREDVNAQEDREIRD
jgi:hypothetical protein